MKLSCSNSGIVTVLFLMAFMYCLILGLSSVSVFSVCLPAKSDLSHSWCLHSQLVVFSLYLGSKCEILFNTCLLLKREGFHTKSGMRWMRMIDKTRGGKAFPKTCKLGSVLFNAHILENFSCKGW